MKKFCIVVILSALLILGLPKHDTPVNKSTTVRAKTQTVQAVAPEKASEVTQAPTEQKTVVEPAAVEIPQVTQDKDCAAYRNILSQYSWNVNVAIEVCNAESSGVPTNDNPTDTHPTCRGSRGLFQIGCDSTNNYEGMFDPSANIAQAYALYARRGWQPWGSTTCRYKVQCY